MQKDKIEPNEDGREAIGISAEKFKKSLDAMWIMVTWLLVKAILSPIYNHGKK